MAFRVLVIGDVVGSPGRELVRHQLKPYVKANAIDFVIVNGENAAGGLGISAAIASQFFEWGVDVITTGDHVWKKKDIIAAIQSDIRILRPANYPSESPGRGWTCVRSISGEQVGVVNLVGRTFMPPAECPFKAASRAVEELRQQTRIIFVDMHAEATSEKLGMGWHLDGKVSAVYGTHTHVQTADERVLPNGTAYISDIGMAGGFDSILGRKTEAVLKKFITNMPEPFDVASGDPRMCGALVCLNATTGRAESIERVVIKP
ncbi:MAG TPA: TIGR00282 family metallophosphoesterase [Planctomycetota bacterium]|nr:TIGR00282 family metallophosphoesterase [Planctomycetota bacterium]